MHRASPLLGASTNASVHQVAPPENLFRRFARWMIHDCPTGVRELLYAVPILVIPLYLSSLSGNIVSEETASQFSKAPKEPMSSYNMVPLYDDKGKLFAYQRVLVKKEDQN